MKNKESQLTGEDKLKMLYQKAGKPTSQMKQGLAKSFGILQQEEMKDFDTEQFKVKAWRK